MRFMWTVLRRAAKDSLDDDVPMVAQVPEQAAAADPLARLR